MDDSGSGSGSESSEVGLTLCSSQRCPMRMICERVHYKGSREGMQVLDLTPIGEEASDCNYYLPRQALREGVLRGVPGRMKSNKHVLPHTRRRVTPEELGLTRPDLMVKRHIRKGKEV